MIYLIFSSKRFNFEIQLFFYLIKRKEFIMAINVLLIYICIYKNGGTKKNTHTKTYRIQFNKQNSTQKIAAHID